MRRRESRRRSRHNRTSKSPAMWPGFLAAQIVREYSLLLIFLCKIFPEKLDKARGGRRGILDSPFQSTPPREGGDDRSQTPMLYWRRFQSTPPPARGATTATARQIMSRYKDGNTATRRIRRSITILCVVSARLTAGTLHTLSLWALRRSNIAPQSWSRCGRKTKTASHTMGGITQVTKPRSGSETLNRPCGGKSGRS